MIQLDQWLKLSGIVESGGQAKVLIQAGKVKVNGEIDTRRGRKLQVGDKVEVAGKTSVVDAARLNPSGGGEPLAKKPREERPREAARKEKATDAKVVVRGKAKAPRRKKGRTPVTPRSR